MQCTFSWKSQQKFYETWKANVKAQGTVKGQDSNKKGRTHLLRYQSPLYSYSEQNYHGK